MPEPEVLRDPSADTEGTANARASFSAVRFSKNQTFFVEKHTFGVQILIFG